MKKYLLKNMGCKSNQLEGSLIEQDLKNNGYEKVKDIENADFFILNSCTVTHKSDNEAFVILRHSKRQNPNLKTVLTGCIAQIEKEKLLENPDIDFVIGNDEKLQISKYLDKNYAVNDIMELKNFHNLILKDTEKTRASLKIQDGCDNRCSYCIIPFARGRNRSADLDYIIEQIKSYENAGFKEIVLTGIHIGQWGKDFESPKNLLYLLEKIEEKTNIQRYRLGSLNPLEINDEMLDFLKNSEKFCPHFHLSLQAMCDKTLKSMNRRYSARRALDLIEQIAEIFPLGFIGSDVIAGFAGETDEDFIETIQNLKMSKLTKIHTFPYSIRKGTIAEKLSGHLDDKIKEKRAGIIKQISAQKYQEFLQNNLNSTQEILIEKHLDKKTGFYKGVTKNYISVLIKPTDKLNATQIKRTIQKVKITEVQSQVFGELL